MVLLLVAMMASAAAKSKLVALLAPDRHIFADHPGLPVQSVTGPIDLSGRDLMTLKTPGGLLQIAWPQYPVIDLRASRTFSTTAWVSLPGTRLRLTYPHP